MEEPRQVRRDSAPPGYTTPPFPSLHIPPQDPQWSLYTVTDIWRFILLWTLILYGLFHLGAAGIALLMQVGKKRRNWRYLWLVPLAYIFVAGVEALMAGSVVGLIPTARSTSNSHSPDFIYFPHQPKSLAGIALRSFCLGIALAISIISIGYIAVFTDSPLWRLPFFLGALSLFHFLEFWTTAAYNTRVAEVSSFLLTSNWPGYAIAHSVATLECLVTNVLWPDRSWAPLHSGSVLCFLGILLVATGQTVRSVAMIQAGPSFNHMVQHRRSSGHVLVTTGIYGRLRHPSYFGFFWWALGTQLVLGNLVCFVGYAAVLWRFFSSRIRHEEEFLVRFFGEEYVDYRRKVGTKIPLCP
ncbi:protein-S-isoprenylcysteine O-methyltransferase [Echria macrotheca]|uniref:Protein-S-isoprenylcysteine O-methyltransferase n=1 Tax=Echria macrotheca TaxID=438768 RepID=A0AAJ0B504_9PEZI|nr:protein-S-isoprenylcysteine O-methyltransferase [Echria macrotheca]